MSHSHKPLPSVPSDPAGSSSIANNLGRLTIEGRAHLRQFIKHALAEGSIEHSEGWSAAIEVALNDLGESLAHGCWLAGLKTKRKAENAKRRKEEGELRRKQMQKLAEEEEAKDKKSRSKAKDKEKGKEKADTEEIALRVQSTGSSKSAARSPEETQKMALEQLHEISNSSDAHVSISSPKHLLLTLSTDGAVLPHRDMDFDIVPSSEACVFISGTYTLPSVSSWTWMHGPDPTVLYGLDEWNGKSVLCWTLMYMN